MGINMNAIALKLSAASSNNDIKEVNQIYLGLIHQKMKLDKFFTMYLDKFESKMDAEETNTPVWDLYKKKTKEYAEINQSIRTAEYYLRKS